MVGHYHLADGGQADEGQLEVLDAERDADDGDETGQRRGNVADGQPDPDEHKPENVANQPQGAGADVALARHALAAHRLLAKREEGEGADDEAGASPGDPDEGDEAEQPASHQASPMKTPPSTNQSRLNKKRKKDMWVTPAARELAVTIASPLPGTQWHRREGGQFGSQHAILCLIGGGWRSKWPVRREKE